MKLTFLGGVDEVGASCILCEIAGHRILIDCGIRMHGRSADVLPLLERIYEAGGVEAVIVTHAHTDHIGALPALFQFHSSVPMYLTLATRNLMPILLKDALKIMELKAEEEGQIPLYPPEAVDKTLTAAQPVLLGQTVSLFDGDLSLTFYPAGHILGAASVVLESSEGTLLVTGDVSVTDQRTIPGMVIPPVKPDVIVIESTYGGRFHTSRKAEEKRLIEQTAKIIEREGAILFPVFAIGRSQEVILILLDAIMTGELRRVPIFVDGMVLSVCEVYRSHPELLTHSLRRRLERYGHPFFFDRSVVIPVWNRKRRQEYVKTRPAIFVASSGMLTGGPSQFYAHQFANDAKNFIAITGYQDEESPGRRLQEIAEAGSGAVQIGTQVVTLQCGIGTYGLSAHADTSQLVGCLTGIVSKGARQPDIVLVHGDHDARDALKTAIHEAGLERVHCLRLGQSLEPEIRAQKGTVTAAPDITPFEQFRGERADHEVDMRQMLAQDIPVLAKKLMERDGAGHYYSVQQLMVMCGDTEGANSSKEIERVTRMLRYRQSPFRGHRKVPFLFKVKQQQEQGELPVDSDSSIDAQHLIKSDMHTALSVVDQIFPKDSRLYRRSAHQDETIIVLHFDFPDIAQECFGELIKQVENETGWKVRLHDMPRQHALFQAVKDVLPNDWPLRKHPAIYGEDKKVVVSLNIAAPSPETVESISSAFKEKTRFELVIESLQPAKKQESPIAKHQPHSTSDAQVEANRAFTMIRERFASLPHQPLKAGLKHDQQGQFIEVSFISPEVGERYQELLADLANELGWRIGIRPNPNQYLIQETVKQMVPASWGQRREPSFKQNTKTVVVQVSQQPHSDEIQKISEDFKEATGYTLVPEHKSDWNL